MTEAMYRALLTILPDLLIHVAEDGTILRVTGPTDLLNLPADALMGQKLHAVLPIDWVQGTLHAISQARRTSTSQVCEHSVTLGEVKRDYELRIAIVDHDGILILLRDITASNQVAAAIQQTEAAATATLARQSFLNTMSHELRTPLDAILAMTNLLDHTNLTSEQQEVMAIMRTGIHSLATLLDDTLTMAASMEAGQLALDYRPFNLYECLEQALDLVTPRATEKQLDLIYQIEDTVPPTILGDAGRLSQVVVNLLTNAIKFTPTGEVVLLVTSQLLADDKPTLTSTQAEQTTALSPPGVAPSHTLTITVRDTGVGLSPDQLEQLHWSFRRSDTPISSQQSRSGLGLSICKQLVDVMGGTIAVQSHTGHGSTFHVTVPVTAVADGSPADPPSHPAPLTGKHVLLLEPNPTRRAFLVQRLQGWGMLPWTEDSLAEAFSRMHRGWLLDVAIVDTALPELQDSPLPTHLLHYQQMSNLPVILLAPLGPSTAREVHQSVNVVAVLSIPVKSSHLYAALVHSLTGQRPPPVAEAPSPPPGEHMAQHHPLHILIADDNPVNQRVALLLLDRLGYTADVAHTGREVLTLMQAVQPQPYDVILMDIEMPNLDGIATARHIRATWPHQEQPSIVALTAHSPMRDPAAYLSAGMDYVIYKSVRLEELATTLARCPTRRQRQEQLARSQPEPDEQEPPPSSPLPALTPHPSIDLRILERLVTSMGSDARHNLSELITIFLTHTARLGTDLEHAADQGNSDTLVYIAHTLKSSSACLGAMVLSQLCRQLETAVRTGELVRAKDQATLVIAELVQVQAALVAIRDG